tara:strand:- start:1869 stop:2177 length:309 start_codon:yes stop_codon:yes gene_type:complete
MSDDERTKQAIAHEIIEKVGGDPDDEEFYSKGGTVTRKTYDLVNEVLETNTDEEDTKHDAASKAIEESGGDSEDEEFYSRGGTVTKKALQAIDEALDEALDD